ncbi:MAG: ATP-binding protein [Chitinophagales bacterium]
MPLTKPARKKEIEKRIEELLHTSWDLVTKRNSEIRELSEKALELAESIQSKNYKALALMELALYECLVNNNYYGSIKMCDDAFALLRGEFKKRYEPYYHLNLGRNHHFTGDNVLSQKHYLECIKLLELKQDKNYYEKRWLAHAYYNVFILFNYTGSEFAQDEYLNKALDIYKEIEDMTGVGNCYNSYAVYYFKAENFKASLEYLLKALALAEEESSTSFLSIYCANIGLVYTKLNDFNTALHYFERAREYDKEIDSSYHTAHTFNQMGEAYAIMHKYEEAIEYFKTAEALFEKLGVNRSLSTIAEHLSEAFASNGDFENAFLYKKKYAESLKEVFNEEKTFAIAKARNEFELEKKEREAQLLRQKNEQIEKYANQLEISNNELRQFAHVASHDLREPLRMVSSYVTLLKRSLKEELSQDEREYMDFIMAGTQTMNTLISDLLTLSGINFVKRYEEIDLNHIMKVVCSNLSSQIHEQHVKINFPELPSIIADEIHMIQLFQNLISNAIKYNTSVNPIINISFSTMGKSFRFVISDNGIGIAEEFREKIFLIFQRLHSREEFSGTGIGLAICKKIIDQAGGKIWVEANERGGSDFVFTLPMK